MRNVLNAVNKPFTNRPWYLAIGTLTILIGMKCIAFAGSSFGTSPADPVFPLVCTEPLMRGLPDFSKPPKGTAKYRFGGTCISPSGRVGQQLVYRLEGSWTPAETDPQKPNASESVEFTGYEPFLPERAPGGRIYMYWTARCNKDPWLEPYANCQRLGAYIPDDLGVNVPDLQATSFPRTLNAITPGDRSRLLAEYLRINPPAFGKLLPPLKDQSAARVEPSKKEPAPAAVSKFPSSAALVAPLKITKPPSGARIMQGQLVVQIDPSGLAGNPVTDLEFTWLDTPPNQTRFINPFTVDTKKLVQGYLVDQAVTRGHTGRWEIRARVSGKKPPGPWSPPTPFILALTPQDQTQSKDQSVPGSAFIQKPPPTAPAQSFRGGSGLFRSRGIEETETEAPAPEAEKKP